MPDDDPVYTLKKVMEDIDYSGLPAQYSNKGRNGFNPIMMYATVVYAAMRGIRSVDTIVDLCKRDLAFIWLTQGKQPKRDAFYEFKNLRLTEEVPDDLHYQFVRCLEKEGLVTLKALYIDGTKIEANANRYTFVWRGTINYHLAGLLDKIDALYTRYNTFLSKNGYDQKYGFGHAQMFVIEGMDKVREVIRKNRERKLTVAVENYFIIHTYISNDRTDYNTLIPVLQKHKAAFGTFPEETTADSGYGSEKHLLYLKEKGITSYIKLQDHEKRKTRAYTEDIGKNYNMKSMIYKDEHYYVCHDGRELRHIRTEKKQQEGYVQTFEVYGCCDCGGCEHKAKCL